jgi:hypothetical protein
LLCQGDNARQPVKTIRLEASQSSAAPPALQAARGEIKRLGQFLERKAGSLHQLFNHGGREALADSFAKITLAGEGSSQDGSATQFLHHRTQFVYHLSSTIATIVVTVKFGTRPGTHRLPPMLYSLDL